MMFNLNNETEPRWSAKLILMSGYEKRKCPEVSLKYIFAPSFTTAKNILLKERTAMKEEKWKDRGVNAVDCDLRS